jgi:hypothetical protein
MKGWYCLLECDALCLTEVPLYSHHCENVKYNLIIERFANKIF